ncbi:Uncharacterised protein [Mycoplasmopsis maculosa]|uniref:Uncharacterized protein n=1 Tax=Mycoplasmopsis maculosa TaxID=114885 RepID=A0A449B4Z3_9BACT|nr:hypothetical protein [Mycoplasmopsis maculosa]VEU75598.1 Uncharacterised protein [Mycoplasmopsis maculosa]
MSEFTSALYAKKSNESTNLSLNPSELSEVTNYMINTSLIGNLGTKLTIKDGNKSVVTFLKNIGQDFSPKTKAGIESVSIPLLESVSIHWNTPEMQAIGFTRADMNLGLPNVAAAKLDRAQNDFIKKHEKAGFKIIEDKMSSLSNQKTVKDLSTLSGKNIWLALSEEAIKLQKLESKTDGINGVDREDIVIFVKDEIFNKLAADMIIGNFAQSAALDGVKAINTINGYKIFACPYLNEADAIIATTFTMASMVEVNAANIGTLGITNDLGMYFEAMSLAGIIYESTIRYIAKS